MPNLDGKPEQDALVLVGTLYNTNAIQFEHEPSHTKTDNQVSSQREPLHVVRTLKAQENPLQVRDAMLQHLQQRHQCCQSTGIAPKLQWFFVPSTSQMPNCIELDGYCTCSEEEEFEESDDDDDEVDDDIHGEHECKTDCYWWRDESFVTNSIIQQENETRSCYPKQSKTHSKQLQREERRLNQLRICQSALDARHVVSGYLLKRSNKDKHVWRRVHCVLTEDFLWFVSRLYTASSGIRVALHGRVGLNRALLLEPSPTAAAADYAPLYQIPNAFEVVSRSGISHVFRASSQALQKRWIQCLADRIVTCHENKILEHAELIVEDEAFARNKRLSAVAMEPLMSHTEDANDEMRMGVLRWGMDVADYREQCRHVQSRMPAKRPIVVVNDDNPAAPSPRRLFASSNGQQMDEQLDVDTRDMIRSAWDTAAVLVARATRLVREGNGKASNNLETLCRHVDYVITGRFRPLNETGEAAMDQVDRNLDPPPIDLLDALLAELQSGCSSKRDADKTNGDAIETPLGK